LTFSYDAAHRLTGVTDLAGNTVHRDYDAMDNPTEATVTSSASVLLLKAQAAYDQLSRLNALIRAQ
jgi:YD repeat-containing protein